MFITFHYLISAYDNLCIFNLLLLFVRFDYNLLNILHPRVSYNFCSWNYVFSNKYAGENCYKMNLINFFLLFIDLFI